MKYDREKLYKEVWAEPTSVVSKRYGVSDVALAKACRQLGVPLPPRGYWAKVKAGKPVMERPELPPEPEKKKEPEEKKPEKAKPKRKMIQRNPKALYREDCRAFYHNCMISQEDLLYHFDFLIHDVDEQFSNHSSVYRKKRKAFLKQCRDKVSRMHLPLLTDEWTYYECTESRFGFEIALSKLSELEYEGMDISSASITQLGVFMELEYPLVTLEAFAAVHKVMIDTVNEWLRTGRLSGAIYEDGEWMVPELHQKPDDERFSMFISLEDYKELELEEYPLIKCCQEIYLIPKDNGMVELTYVNHKQDFRAEIMISERECGELLYNLQKQGVLLGDQGVYHVPTYERPDQFMEDVCEDWSLITKQDVFPFRR